MMFDWSTFLGWFKADLLFCLEVRAILSVKGEIDGLNENFLSL